MRRVVPLFVGKLVADSHQDSGGQPLRQAMLLSSTKQQPVKSWRRFVSAGSTAGAATGHGYETAFSAAVDGVAMLPQKAADGLRRQQRRGF